MSALTVELFTGRVQREGRTIRLRASEWELLWALVLPGRPVPRTELAAIVRPDADDDHALGALDVRVHRLRARIGPRTIERTEFGYRLAETVVVDVRTYERFAREMRAVGTPAPQQIQRCRDIYDVLSTWRMPEFLRSREFAIAVERRFDAVLHEVEHRLARHALELNESEEALAIAGRALERDACDEAAWDVAIRAHLALGDRGSAMRDFRRCASALGAELDLEPSAELRQLVQSGAAA